MPTVERKFRGAIELIRETEAERVADLQTLATHKGLADEFRNDPLGMPNQLRTWLGDVERAFTRAASDVLKTQVLFFGRRVVFIENFLNDRYDEVPVIWSRYLSTRKPLEQTSAPIIETENSSS